jgi:[ribosomal protein S5]-alanine N-acetyltransferase
MTGEVRLAPPRRDDQSAFLAAAGRSRELHGDWVQPPADEVAFVGYLGRAAAPNNDFSLAWHGDELVGVVNLSEIIRGPLQQAFMGFYAFAPQAGRGLMTQAVKLGLRRAFDDLGLHRVEANVQPHNARSLALVQRAGFHREGFSARYLFIAGAWRDHERWAAISEDEARPGGMD